MEYFFPTGISASVSYCLSGRCSKLALITYSRNLIYIGIFSAVELAFALVAASYFATADGRIGAGIALKKSGGAFAFIAGLFGYYTVANLMCQDVMFFSFPMGDTSRFFQRKTVKS